MAVLSAGVGLETDAEEFTVGNLETMLAVNVLGVARWLEALQPVLKAQPGGATVGVVSSLSADRALPGAGAGYSASKAAVSQLCDGLRAPWASLGIRLVTVAPGFVRTPMTRDIADMPLLMEPEDAARVILGGLRAGKSVVRFPRLASLTMSAVRLLPPRLLDRLYHAPAGGAGEASGAGTSGRKAS
jgi:NAD(P)-dependent dehydrogenase (short-subunit alcohol dehydrogenase family)